MRNPFMLIAKAKEITPRKRVAMIYKMAKELLAMAKEALKEPELYETIQEWAREKERDKELSEVEHIVSKIEELLGEK